MAAAKARRVAPLALDTASKAALYLEKKRFGGKVGRFAIQRTIEHLEQCDVVMKDDVKSVEVRLHPTSQQHHGARQFCYEHLPQLRYRNPLKELIMIADASERSGIAIQYDASHHEFIEIDGESKSEIYKAVLHHTS